MTAQHTPGPWSAVVIRKNNMDRGTVMVATTYHGGMAIDCFDSGKNFNESAANACLIAAAPDLLEALQAFMALDKTFTTICDAHLEEQAAKSAMGRAVKLARAAIARAQGEQE